MRVADAALCSNFFPLSFRSLISFSIDKVRVNILSPPAGYITHTKKKREERREKKREDGCSSRLVSLE